MITWAGTPAAASARTDQCTEGEHWTRALTIAVFMTMGRSPNCSTSTRAGALTLAAWEHVGLESLLLHLLVGLPGPSLSFYCSALSTARQAEVLTVASPEGPQSHMSLQPFHMY